ncbi:hypothetical protein ACLBPK_24375, partial [Klebsiella pneumoniae]|uniref:hypothetical protein n=1 Tax=Klebsiella pneumoniae TaxID=573 RepID=UPI003967F510
PNDDRCFIEVDGQRYSWPCASAGRVVSLAVSAQTGTPGNSRRKVNVGNKRNDTGINRVCASSQKWIEVLVYRFFPAPAALWAIPGIS